MTDIVEFLNARIDEDEAVVREVVAEMARAAAQYVEGAAPDPTDAEMFAGESFGDPVVIVGPARVLAECAAKRAIIEAWRKADEDAGPWPGTETGFELGLALALDLLARAYKDHPSYDPDWDL